MVEKTYGSIVDLGPCLVTRNLNLRTLRGSSSMDKLALVSAPDVFDPITNVHGSQRPLDMARTAALLRYAQGLDAEGEATAVPRAFPEILLNVREQSCIELYDFNEPSRLVSFSSETGFQGSADTLVVGVRVDIAKLEFPKPLKNPQISRFDGNHRLAGMDAETIKQIVNGSTYVGAPDVPFALYVGLSPTEEMRLFNTINSKQKPVEPALLETQRYGMLSDAERITPANLPSYLAHFLTEENGAFQGIVDMGGSKAGAKQKGLRYQLRISSLRTAIQGQLKSARPATLQRLQQNPEHLLWHVNNYWLAVRAVFPDAWADKENYVLLQTIGLSAMGQYWGLIVDDVKGAVEDYVPLLMPIAEKDLLNRSLYPGVAGAKGGDIVFGRITTEVTDLDRRIAESRATWKPLTSASDVLEV